MSGQRLGVVGLCLALIAIGAPHVRGANILGMFTSHSPSHLIIHMSVIKTLAENGHNVTVVTMQKPTVMHKDIHLIYIPATEEQNRVLEGQMKEMAGQKGTVFGTMYRLMSGMSVVIEAQLELLSDPRFQRIYETKFDLMFLGYFVNDFQMGVAAKLKVPVIISWMQTSVIVTDDYVGNPSEVSYVPNIMTPLGREEKMGFTKRFENWVKQKFGMALLALLDRRSERLYLQHFGNKPGFPTLKEMRRNVSMVFTNSHSLSEGPIRPFVPAIVEIGGIQIKEQPDPLPEDIAQFLEKSQHGAILLSLGTNIKSTAIKPKVMQVIFKVLSSLKQHVIFKWEDLGNTPGQSANILYQNWLPQGDILAHPKVKLFITHAGKGGISEARYHGVPMVALPIFADQPANAAGMEASGYGRSVDLQQLTEESFRAAIEDVLGNKTYVTAIQRFSKLYRDRPLTAKQTVLYWTDYVLRHKGAVHLQSPSVHMNFVALHNLDVYAAVFGGLFTIIFLVWLAAKRICCSKPKKVKKAKRR